MFARVLKLLCILLRMDLTDKMTPKNLIKERWCLRIPGAITYFLYISIMLQQAYPYLLIVHTYLYLYFIFVQKSSLSVYLDHDIIMRLV